MDYKGKTISIIILAGSRDFGRCPVATRWSTALWPVAGRPAVELLLENLAEQGINEVIICSNGESSLLKKLIKPLSQIKVEFLNEPLPVGTAGAIRQGSYKVNADLIIVLPANITNPPDIGKLFKEHCESKADLSVVFDPADENIKAPGQPADIYVCSPSVLRYIPKDGYFDIKEGLIPSLIQECKNVRAMILPKNTGVFRNRREYLEAVGTALSDNKEIKKEFKLYKHNGTESIWKNGNVFIDSKVRIHGPVAIMTGAHISKDAVLIGPVLIGRNVTIADGALVTNSVLWDGAQVGNDCKINGCIIDYNTRIKSGACLEAKALAFEPEWKINQVIRKYKNRATQAIDKILKSTIEKIPAGITLGLAIVFIFAAFLWAYWAAIVELFQIWQRSDEYSSGLLVPFLAVYVLWSRRDQIAQLPIKPFLWGILALIFAQAVRLFGLFFMYGSAERISIVLTIAAMVLMLFGWDIFKKVSTVLLFLFLMLPWPSRVQAAVARPMQQWATSSAVFCLEMLGFAVVREGNIIHIGQSTVAVAEACNGLRMVMAFFVITGLVVLLVQRRWWEKLIILISSLPIALLCNTIRLTVTAMAFTIISGEKWETVFHDFGGYAMMPLALGLVVGELWLITKLTTVPMDTTEQLITSRKAKTSH